MSIISKQINEKIKEKTLEYLQKGEVPGNMFILREIRDFLKNVGIPTIKFRPVGKNSAFNIADFNLTLDEIKFDIEILYKELIDHFKNVLSSYHVTQSVYDITSADLDRLLNLLNEELLLLKNGDDNFNVFIEDFSDLEKTNQNLTTKKSIDVNAKTFSLPISNNANFRVPTDHLASIQSWAINILSNQPIVSNSPSVGAGFGNAFSDIVSPWRQVIRTGTAGVLDLEFIFPIAAPAEVEKEVLINQISITPHADFPFNLRILKSVDNVNWTYLPGYSTTFNIYKESTTINMSFPTELVQYLKFEVSIPEANKQVSEKEWEYIFGFKSIAYYQLGRSSSAVYISKPFESSNNIGKVIIEASDKAPAGTSIDYYVGLADATGELTGKWEPIKPINGILNTFAPNIVRFSEINSREISYVASTGSLYETYKAVNYYTINSGNAISDTVIYGTAQLERGENIWTRNSVEQKEEYSIQNAYVSFSTSDNAYLYVIESENLTPLTVSGQQYVTIQLNNSILYDQSKGDEEHPSNEVDPNFHQSPNYAIYEMNLVRKNRLKTLTVTGVKNLAFYLPTGVTPDKQERPSIKVTKITTSGGSSSFPDRLLREEVDYNIRRAERVETVYSVGTTEESSSFWAQRIAEKSTLDFYVEYYEEDSLLDRIVNINTSLNTITLELPNTLFNISDYIYIRYRAIPKYPNYKVFPTSIKAHKQFNSNTTDYILGQDYTIDLRNGKVYRTENGTIESSSSIYVDFKYEKRVFDTETYGVWCYVNRTDLPEIPITFSIDKSLGEAFILNNLADRKTIDLINLNKIPRLGKGWYQFIVKSKNPDLFSTNAINKVIALKDSSGNPVFQSNNYYFSKVIGAIEPLKQVSFDYLKRSVLPTQYNFFAIKDGLIILNFMPNSGNGFYPYYYDNSAGALSRVNERFTLTYQNPEIINVNKKLLTKIELSRNPSIDGGITPEVKSYIIRVGP